MLYLLAANLLLATHYFVGVASQTVVDVSQSTVSGDGVTNVNPAGVWSNFQVQLRDSAGQNIETFCDSLLSCTCYANVTLSYCEVQPIIRPLGSGLYSVSYIVGTIWGSHATWPPVGYNNLQPLPAAYFQGNNSLYVRYNGTDLPGSPFKLPLKPNPEVSARVSALNMNSPQFAVASTRSISIARFYQIMDAWGNWIRSSSLTGILRGSATLRDGPNGTLVVPLGLRWWSTNWWVDFSATLSISGTYAVQAFIQRPDNTTEPLRIIQADGSVVYEAPLEVKPGPLDPRAFTVDWTRSSVVAGQMCEVAVQARDSSRNAAWMVAPASYQPLRAYSVQEQNFTLVQVNTTLPWFTSWQDGRPGLAVLQFATLRPGAYNIQITYQATSALVSLGTCVVAPGPVNMSMSWAAGPPAAVVAGTPWPVTVQLQDRLGNPTAGDPGSLSFTVLSSEGQQVVMPVNVAVQGPGLYRFDMWPLTAAGQYLIQATYSCDDLQVRTGQVLVVVADPVMALNQTRVEGMLVGESPSQLEWSELRQLDNGSSIRLTAGQWYFLRVAAHDVYENLQVGTLPGFHLSPDFTAVCSNLTTIDGGDGSTMMAFSLWRAGLHNMSVLSRGGQVAVTGSVLVEARELHPGRLQLSAPGVVEAGQLMQAHLVLQDVFGNAAADRDVSLLELAPASDNTTQSTAVAVLMQQDAAADVSNSSTEQGLARFTLNLTQSGQYAVYCSHQHSRYLLGQVLVVPGGISASTSTVTVLPDGVDAVRLFGVARDSYGNNCSNGLWSNITNITANPSLALSLTLLSPDLLRVRFASAGTYQLDITVNGSVQLTSNVSLPSPPPPPTTCPTTRLLSDQHERLILITGLLGAFILGILLAALLMALWQQNKVSDDDDRSTPRQPLAQQPHPAMLLPKLRPPLPAVLEQMSHNELLVAGTTRQGPATPPSIRPGLLEPSRSRSQHVVMYNVLYDPLSPPSSHVTPRSSKQST